MSLTVDELAKEIGRIYEGDDAWCRMVATGLFPFIERHIAAGQPKPAGAVPLPLPEPVAKRSTTHGGEILCEPVYSAEQLRAYGAAREAAGRAVAVPEGFALVPRELTEDMSLEAQVQVAGVDDEMLSEIWEAFLRKAAPIPQQPAADGAGREAVADALLWLRSALDCFPWSPDQREAAESAYAAAIRPTPAADAGVVTVVDARSPNFLAWCGQWFGPDSDESYLAKAVNALTPKVRHGE